MAGAMLRRWIATGAVQGADVFVLNRSDRDLPDGVRQGRVLPHGALPDAVMLTAALTLITATLTDSERRNAEMAAAARG